MWRIEDVLSELKDEEDEAGKNDNSGLAPGFRFHPTDEELITFYLASKVFNHPTTTTTTPSTSSSAAASFATAIDIAEIDLNRCEPWDLPERARMGEREWYFYSLRDRKYPTGLRTNRATGSGYWKATGKDRQVYSAATTAAAKTGTAAGGGGGGALIGMKKTLVFYQGRAPRGVKTRWVMHEYRLDGHFSSFRLSSKEEWVICRIFHKHGHGGGGAEKKHSHITSRRPFLDSLPPLLETQAQTRTQTQTQTQTLDSLSQLLPQHHQDHTNFLLNNLLNNQHHRPPPPPLQFSTASTTINDPLPPSILFEYLKPLPASITSTAGVPKQSNPEMEQQKQSWMDKIWPQIQHTNNTCPLLNCYDDELYPPHPFTAGGGGGGGGGSGAGGRDGAVHVDMSDSVAALDRILHPLPPPPIKVAPEAWSFHP